MLMSWIGYAEVTDNAIDSWRSLLERYLTVRESLSLVLHLIDSRQGMTDTDQQVSKLSH
jgi:GTP-binding protein EngB required for normal cell division